MRGDQSAAARIADWIQDAGDTALIAIDAPLGWPRALGQALAAHQAGDEIDVKANELFRRTTDRYIQQHLRKTPLDVGADRIARTARAALRILGELRRSLNQPIPLAWTPDPNQLSAIEVYPAATLISRRIRSGGYKKPADIDERREIIQGLAGELDIKTDLGILEQNADALDAVVCLDTIAGQLNSLEV